MTVEVKADEPLTLKLYYQVDLVYFSKMSPPIDRKLVKIGGEVSLSSITKNNRLVVILVLGLVIEREV